MAICHGTMIENLSTEHLGILDEAAILSKGFVLDMVESARSGHLGAALGCSHIGAALFGNLLHFNPDDPRWINRDRFILSCGHASAFLYAWLYLTGCDLSTDDLGNFRKMSSKTPGHPEFGRTSGVECTTGPLGQGVANAVGMAIGAKKAEHMFNTPECAIFDYKIVCLCGDGCLQEGVALEACSIAGHLKLDNLILIYDRNNVTLDGELSRSQSDDAIKKFEAHGFEVIFVDGNDVGQLIGAYGAETMGGRPRLIIADTLIGDGIDEVSGTNRAHGEYGVKFASSSKAKLGLPDQKFYVSDRVKKFFNDLTIKRIQAYDAWQLKFKKWAESEGKRHDQLVNTIDHCDALGEFRYDSNFESISMRAANSHVMQFLAKFDSKMITGSADLFSSCKNHLDAYSDFSAVDRAGRNIQFGVREHAMCAIVNGICYDGIFNVSCSTFLVFSDYMRAAIRIAALAKLHALFLFTHDSIAVGQDGPTHQPVETLASLRCIPNLYVVRPADSEELVGAWELYFEKKDAPFAFILSRQDLPVLSTISIDVRRGGVKCGAYIAFEEKNDLRCIIVATGSELCMAMEAAKLFDSVRVVSMPCMERFEEQSMEYRERVFPKNCLNRIALEAGISMPWYKHVGACGECICVKNFGFSGSQEDLCVANDMTVDKVVEKLNNIIWRP